jgi:hypothetical protein
MMSDSILPVGLLLRQRDWFRPRNTSTSKQLFRGERYLLDMRVDDRAKPLLPFRRATTFKIDVRTLEEPCALRMAEHYEILDRELRVALYAY